MGREIPNSLIAKSLAGKCSAGEQAELERWKEQNCENKKIFSQMEKNWDFLTPENYIPDIDKALNKVNGRLGTQKPRTFNFNRFWVGAAAALILGLGFFSLYTQTVRKAKIITIDTTARLSPREIVLPDGTFVTLGKNSTITYPARFSSKERKVKFHGEAYFKVTPDARRAFIVLSGNTVTKVLGTEFNLKSVTGDSIVRLTVTKGLVSFNTGGLNPNEEIRVAAGEVGELHALKGEIKKFKNTDPNFLAWKTGVITFENQLLPDAVKTLSEYYNQAFALSPGLDTVSFTTTFDSLTVGQVVENLKIILNVNIELKSGVYVLSQKL
ncbi:MAG: FecR domain-containing protein [Bacteroidales bacterium]|nr:FecR domain-containing protein [Bacteroidales bacterium]